MKKIYCPFCVAFMLLLRAAVVQGAGLIVSTSKGPVRGRFIHSIYSFQSIPYVHAPVGSLRYMPPVDMKPWTAPKGAFHFPSMCPQVVSFSNFTLTGNEDCLYLNVFSPNTNGSYPVLVWIHGGGYEIGSGTRFPVSLIAKQIVQQGIVMVTLNYRLNALGFFAAGGQTTEVTPNLGMLDQVKALAWVQREIRNFGGDPTRVTIDGESAGAASVSLQTYSKLSRGFFNQAIMQSGTALVPWALDGVYAKSTASMRLAIAANCSTQSKWNQKQYSGLRACLQVIPWRTLFTLVPGSVSVIGDWLPVVDGKGGFLEDFPSNLARPSNFTVMMGSNHDEWAFFLLQLKFGILNISQMNQQFFNQNVKQITNSYFQSTAVPVTQLMNFAYVDSQKFKSSDPTGWIHAVSQLQSEVMIHGGTVAEANSLASNNQTVYLYSFDFVSKSFWGNFSYPGVLHFYDVLYLFPGVDNGSAKWKPSDVIIQKIFSTLWSNFVIYGNPTPESQSLNYSWSPVSNLGGSMSYLSINEPPQMMQYFHTRAYGFFDVLLPQISKQFRPLPVQSTPRDHS